MQIKNQELNLNNGKIARNSGFESEGIGVRMQNSIPGGAQKEGENELECGTKKKISILWRRKKSLM